VTSLDLHPLQRVIPDGSVLRVIDLETTGVDPATAMIVQIAMIVLHPSGEIQRWCSLVDPEIPIPAEATTIHGITDERVRGARTWARLAPQLAPKLESAVIGGYNVRAYDLAVLDAACRRVGVSFDPERPLVLDALEIWRRHEPRDLASALRYYLGAHEARAESESPEPTGAHDAAGDAWDALRLLAAQLAQYEDLPRTARELDAYGLDLAEGALDRTGRIVWRDGEARLTFGAHAGRALHAVESSYLRWMMRQNFGRSTLQIIEATLLGGAVFQPTVEAALLGEVSFRLTDSSAAAPLGEDLVEDLPAGFLQRKIREGKQNQPS